MLRELATNTLPLPRASGAKPGAGGGGTLRHAAMAALPSDSDEDERPQQQQRQQQYAERISDSSEDDGTGESRRGSGGAAGAAPARPALRRLKRNDKAQQPIGPSAVTDDALDGDLLEGFARMGMGSHGSKAPAAPPVPEGRAAPAALPPPSAAPSRSAVPQAERFAAPPQRAAALPPLQHARPPPPPPPAARAAHAPTRISDSGSGDSSSSSGEKEDEEDFEPFYQRLSQPPGAAAAKAVAAGGAGAATGALGPPAPGSLVLGANKQYVLPAPVAQTLYPHQVKGVTWLWSLYEMRKGGILGDDMGLGKTMQCAAFLAGLFGSRLAQRALIIAPKTLLSHWQKELAACGLRSLTREFFGTSETERAAALRSVTGYGRGVLVTTYGMVQHNAAQLAAAKWDVMLLDEGHKIKNPKMKLVEQLHRIPVPGVRVIISGTPVQNNLAEMHALFDFTTEGLLGDSRDFKKNYEKPITRGLDREASARERQVGAAIAAELRQRIEPYFLRREKKDVLPETSSSGGGGGAGGSGGGAGRDADAGASSSSSGGEAARGGVLEAPQGRQAQGLPRKNDLVVWLRLTPLQRKIYTAFLHTDSVKQVLNEKQSPLAAITVLKKICDHPALLSARAAQNVIRGAHRWAKSGGRGSDGQRRRGGYHGGDYEEDVLEDSSDESGSGSDGEGSGSGHDAGSGATQGAEAQDAAAELPSDWLGDGSSLDSALAHELEQRGADASCKSVFVLALVQRLHSEGHRTLIFSQSKVMLNILEAGVRAMQLPYCRIDGDLSADERHAQVQHFQTRASIPVFLLTSQVGGLGLTLTAANRVIIVDPAWNPSVDNQSVDRAYRMGQTRDVVVYRLITCGTAEEKIYRKQVFKGGLSRTGTEEGIQFRYFTRTELCDLFTVTPEGLQNSATQAQLRDQHAHQRRATPELTAHLEYLQKHLGVAGIHDHDLLFSQRPQEHAPSAQEGAAILSQMGRSGSGAAGVDALATKLGAGMRLDEPNGRHAVAVDAARRKVEELGSRLTSMQATMSSSTLRNMADGGARVRQNMQAVQQQYDEALAALAALAALEGGVRADAGPAGAASSAQPPPHASGGSANWPPPEATSRGDETPPPPPGPAAAPPRPTAPAAPPPLAAATAAPAPALRPPVRPGGFGSGAALRAASRTASGDSSHSPPTSAPSAPWAPAGHATAAPAAGGGGRHDEHARAGAPAQRPLPAAETSRAESSSFVTADSAVGLGGDADEVTSQLIDLTVTP